jgi:hypothetical protein
MRASGVVAQRVEGIGGRGGGTLCGGVDGGGLLAVGGSNRSGDLFSDQLVFTQPALAPRPLPAGQGGCALPGIGGHSATSVSISGAGSGVLLFGGINFVEETVAAGLYERWAGSGWREIPPVPQKTPSGRTGHTLSAVPPPIILSPAPSAAGTGAAAPAGAPALALREVVGWDASAPLAVLFAGSTPADGPLCDLHLLRCSSGGPAAEGLGARQYTWSTPATTGPAPGPRELHAAFVRPAIVQLEEASSSSSGSGGGGGSSSGETVVHLLAPAALCVHGGRSEDGAPLRDLCVLDLQALAWLPPVKTPHALCSSAAAPSPNGLALLQFGGLQGGSGGLSGACLVLDTGASGAALAPEAWGWSAVALPPPAPPPRFAAAAGALAFGAGEGGDLCRLCVWGGMTVEEDLAIALWIDVPLQRPAFLPQ